MSDIMNELSEFDTLEEGQKQKLNPEIIDIGLPNITSINREDAVLKCLGARVLVCTEGARPQIIIGKKINNDDNQNSIFQLTESQRTKRIRNSIIGETESCLLWKLSYTKTEGNVDINEAWYYVTVGCVILKYNPERRIKNVCSNQVYVKFPKEYC